MPQNLNNRLELLEKEIYGLLRLQEQQCAEIQNVIPYEYCIADQPYRMMNAQRVRSGTQVVLPTKCNAGCKPCSKTKSFIESRDTSPNRHTQNELKNANKSPPCYCRFSATTEGSTKRKLNEEKEKVEQAHKIIEDLREELTYSKARMCTMAKDMSLLTDALQSIRNKYKNIKLFRKDAVLQINELKTVNGELCRKLEQEMKSHASQVKNIKDKELAKVEYKVKQEATKLLEQSEQQYQKMQVSNDKLKQNIKELNDRYTQAKNEIENLKCELNSYAQEKTNKKQETEDLQALLKNERSKNVIISKTIDRLESTVGDLMKVEKKAQMEINDLKEQIEELEQTKGEYKNEVTIKDRECKKLQCECERLKKQISEFATEDTAKCKKIEREMEKLKMQMKDKESVIMEEKNTLKCLVQELSEVVKRHKVRIRELVLINRQQEGLLKNQMIVLRNKEHQVKMSEVETEAAKNKNDHLQDQIDKLRTSLKKYEKIHAMDKQKDDDCDCKVKCVLQKLDETKQILQEEQDKLLIKEKIIDDQADTIQKLKNSIGQQGNELKQHNCEVAKLQKELENEKYDKEQLQQNIEDITWHKQQLKDQITQLEKALQQKTNIPVKMDQQKKLLVSLEHQVSMKQKEWELRCKLLNTEKKRAVQAAKFATQKLVDTVNDFQTQADSQKQVQAMLTNMVQNKNKELKCACRKISEFQDMMKQRESCHKKKDCCTRNKLVTFDETK